MTLNNLKLALISQGVMVRNVDGELQVKLAEWRWDDPGVYFTDDREDAMLTGLAMRRASIQQAKCVQHAA